MGAEYTTTTFDGGFGWEQTSTVPEVSCEYSESHLDDCDGLCYDCEEGSYCWASKCNETENI